MGRPCINRGRSATKKSDEEQDYSKWDPVKWFSQRGYNVTQMIHAPGMKIEKKKSFNSLDKNVEYVLCNSQNLIFLFSIPKTTT